MTIREKKAAELILENLPKDKPDSPSTIAKTAGTTTETMRNMFTKEETKTVFKPVVKRLEELRDNAIIAVGDKDLRTVEYQELMNGIDKLTRNIQLLSGQDTDRTNFSFTWKQDAEDNNTILATEVGYEAPQLQGEVESLRIASPSGENSGNPESFAERCAFYPE